MLKFKGRVLVEGIAKGEVLVSKDPISFLGDIDPETGNITRRDSDIQGLTVKDKILIFPHGKGSTVGSYIIYRLKKRGCAPKAILNLRSDLVTIIGCVISEIPLLDMLPKEIFEKIRIGNEAIVDAYKGEVIILK